MLELLEPKHETIFFINSALSSTLWGLQFTIKI